MQVCILFMWSFLQFPTSFSPYTSNLSYYLPLFLSYFNLFILPSSIFYIFPLLRGLYFLMFILLHYTFFFYFETIACKDWCDITFQSHLVPRTATVIKSSTKLGIY